MDNSPTASVTSACQLKFINSKSRLDKIRKNKDGFLWIQHGRKAVGLMEMGPREATQGELQGEL